MINLLWTGGWDSTFRLLQLARAGADIQPHYIRNSDRKSLKKEIQVMSEIRKKVIERFPEAYIREVAMVDQSEISVCEEFSQAHGNLSLKAWIGTQYIYIASYCKQKNIESMELSIERLNKSRYTVMPCLENTEIDQDGRRVISKRSDNDILKLFGRFSFPILALTKLDMLADAKKNGMLEILNMTWFCHQPLFGKPCGTCGPCMSTLEEGHRYRFSSLSLARYRLKQIVVRYPKLHQLLRDLRYSIMSRLKRMATR